MNQALHGSAKTRAPFEEGHFDRKLLAAQLAGKFGEAMKVGICWREA